MTTATAEDLSTPIPKVPDLEMERKALRAEAPDDDPRPRTEDPKAQEIFSFDISIVDGAGKKWEGTFTNRILGMDERIELGVLASRLALGTPWAALDPETQWLCQAQAHLTISLDTDKGGQRPRWFKLAGEDAIKNTRIIAAVYEEVAAHEAYFRGSPTGPRKGEG